MRKCEVKIIEPQQESKPEIVKKGEIGDLKKKKNNATSNFNNNPNNKHYKNNKTHKKMNYQSKYSQLDIDDSNKLNVKIEIQSDMNIPDRY